ncbi:MAG: NADH-quinone oxidoreductase subunit J [Gemmataceae bacterium]
MTLTTAIFAVLAAVTGVAALGVVLTKSVVRAAVWLLVTLIGVSLTYFLLGAEFLGAAQLIVYVGGTLVLVVFGIMLTAGGPRTYLPARAVEWAVGGVVAAGLFAGLVAVSLGFAADPTPPDGPLPGTAPLGLSFLGVPEKPGGLAFLLPFEIVSVHLLVVLIAAAYLARAKQRKTPEGSRG